MMQLEYIMSQMLAKAVLYETDYLSTPNTTLVPSQSISTNKFRQSQSHGLIWDSEIRVKVFGLPECINDTRKYDIECQENPFQPNENVSIKTSCSDTIDCGDILRFFNNQFTDGIYTNIIIIRYKQVEDTKQIKEIVEFKYDEHVRNFLFGTVSIVDLEQYCGFIKAIPKGTVSQECKMAYKKMKKQLQMDHKMIINISPKVDSKNQRRVQCSIPKMDRLFEQFPQNIISRTKEPVIKGVQITEQIKSPSRIRFMQSETNCLVKDDLVKDDLVKYDFVKDDLVK